MLGSIYQAVENPQVAGDDLARDGYLSDDMESRLRMRAPTVCRLCRRLVARISILSGEPQIRCGRLPGNTEAEDVINGILFRDARRTGECQEASLMRELIGGQT